MLSNEERDALLASSPAPTVTKEGIAAKIKNTEFVYPEKESTLTLCVLTLENGFTVVGKSACANPENFNAELGQRIAFDDAFGQVWALEGYLLRQALWIEANNQKSQPEDDTQSEDETDAGEDDGAGQEAA